MVYKRAFWGEQKLVNNFRVLLLSTMQTSTKHTHYKYFIIVSKFKTCLSRISLRKRLKSALLTTQQQQTTTTTTEKRKKVQVLTTSNRPILKLMTAIWSTIEEI